MIKNIFKIEYFKPIFFADVAFGQFHQCFMREFYVQKYFSAAFSTYMKLGLSCQKDVRTKNFRVKC